jgi:hypothetical protein
MILDALQKQKQKQKLMIKSPLQFTDGSDRNLYHRSAPPAARGRDDRDDCDTTHGGTGRRTRTTRNQEGSFSCYSCQLHQLFFAVMRRQFQITVVMADQQWSLLGTAEEKVRVVIVIVVRVIAASALLRNAECYRTTHQTPDSPA